MNKPKVLGKGLNALMAGRSATAAVAVPAPEAKASGDSVIHIAVDEIQPNPEQPRHVFKSQALEELAQSIRANGIIQPLVVRRRQGQLQLVAGERRLRAARLAGLAEVPAIVQEFPDERLLEVTLIENLQREDLNLREVERVARRMTEVQEQPKTPEEADKTDPNVKAAIGELERVLGTKVRIVERARHKGRIEIEYYSSEDLDRIYSLIVGESN
jgi:ParB family chromosome partitioning protein